MKELLIAFAMLCITAGASAQIPDFRNDRSKTDRSTLLESLKNGRDIASPTSLAPLEGPVNPDTYIVGPSDQFLIGVWGPLPVEQAVPVTPEGTLVIPTVGELQAAGKTLREVKEAAVKAIRRLYTVGDITVTLAVPRAFTVTLMGAVLNPGQYLASSTDRVERVVFKGSTNTVITQALNVPLVPSYEKDAELTYPRLVNPTEWYQKTSTRNIRVRRKNGTVITVDIPKFYATGDDRYNPYLLDGDVITVPMRDLEQNFVAIHGAVNKPGQYEYVEGDRLQDIVAIAEGFTTLADTTTVRISRLDETGRSLQEIAVDLSASDGAAQNATRLERGDRIVIGARNDLRRNYKVTIEGEVTTTGTFPISAGTTRLSEVIRSAGGFNENALLTGATVFRKKEYFGEDANPSLIAQENVRAYPFVASDSLFFLANVKAGYDPVNVNFDLLFRAGDKGQDVILRDNDFIYVPKDAHTILVQGQVARPGYVPFVPGADYMHYIEQAGGFTEYADDGKTRIIKRATRSWIDPDDTKIESGDVVWIPKDPVRDFAYYMSITRDIGLLISSIVTIGLILVQINILTNQK